MATSADEHNLANAEITEDPTADPEADRSKFLAILVECLAKLDEVSGDSLVFISYRMKIYTEYNLATWHIMVEFTDLNISEFEFLNLKDLAKFNN